MVGAKAGGTFAQAELQHATVGALSEPWVGCKVFSMVGFKTL